MISLHKCVDRSSIRDLKAEYLSQLVEPMDGMWDTGFTNPAPHWEVTFGGELAGYYAANDEGTLLQFYVRPAFLQHGRAIFDHVIAQESVTNAVVSTIDPLFLSYCLDVQKELTVHTLLYEIHSPMQPSHSMADGTVFRMIEASELERTVSFQQACLGGETDLSGWLRGYSENLIERNELFVLCRRDEWLGLGEARNSDTQEGITDLGMMVAPSHRGYGWATNILALLHAHTVEQGRRAICSTTVENVGAQKAVERAGFVSRHRIMTVTF